MDKGRNLIVIGVLPTVKNARPGRRGSTLFPKPLAAQRTYFRRLASSERISVSLSRAPGNCGTMATSCSKSAWARSRSPFSP